MTRRVLLLVLLLAGCGGPALAGTALSSALLGDVHPRAIGPGVTGGRIAALAVLPTRPREVWVGAASGGVWRSTDGGLTFKPKFDDQIQSIGAIAVDPSNPETIWVGTGESWVRNSVSVGDGVWRSTDAGESWTHLGLDESEHVARIAVDPRDGKRAFVCATGHLWDDHPDRGVFRTTDAGAHWEQVLHGDGATGCADLALDPQEPTVVYAALWDHRRTPWGFRSGGPGSGLYRSIDGGTSWGRLTEGLPAGELGRIGLALSPSRPSRVWAVVEAHDDTALYRSDDLGRSFVRTGTSFDVAARPFYFARVVADPVDPERVWKPGFGLVSTSDGGKSFNPSIGSFHGDVHDVVVLPDDPKEVWIVTDGGLYRSFDRGGSWHHFENLPIAQLYEVAVDDAEPYHVYGGLQDNGSWRGPSEGPEPWRNVGWGDGFDVVVHDPDTVFVEYQGGRILKVHPSTGETQEIPPFAAADEKALRFSWDTPLVASPTRPEVLYTGAQFLFRSEDGGSSWARISPDLTTNDPNKQKQLESGGLTIDNSTAENFTTIVTIAESAVDSRVLWVGTDDGNLQLSKDGGTTWSNLAAKIGIVPAGTWVSHLEASSVDVATVYATFDGHRSGDRTPYVVRSTDFGATWTSLATPALEGWAHVVREDPTAPDLLFLGTEHGLWASADAGATWARFEEELPRRVPVDDLAFSPHGDLVVGTHGRGFWIVDDLEPLRALARGTPLDEGAALVFLPSRPAVLRIASSLQIFPGDDELAVSDPPPAARIAYVLRKRLLFGDLTIDVVDRGGNVVSTLAGGRRVGINRVLWPMRLPPPKVPPATTLAPAILGPRVAEGSYTIRLHKGDETFVSTIEVVADPRSSHSPADRALQQQTAMALYRDLATLTGVVDQLRGWVEAIDRDRGALPARLRRRMSDVRKRVESERAALVATRPGGILSGEKQLREKLGELYAAVNGNEGRPTASQLDRRKALATELGEARGRVDRLRREAIEPLDAELVKRGLAGIVAAGAK